MFLLGKWGGVCPKGISPVPVIKFMGNVHHFWSSRERPFLSLQLIAKMGDGSL
jgi:hypothetical protein